MRYGTTMAHTAPRRLRWRLIILPGTALLLCRAFFFQTYAVPSASMRRTLEPGDVVLADRSVYGLRLPFTDGRTGARRDPAPDDLLIFSYQDEPGRTFVKRCVACGGQAVEIRDRVLLVDGSPFPLPVTGMSTARDTLPAGQDVRDNYGPVTIPPDAYFCLGDNRDNSRDSRYRGSVPRCNLHGRALLVLFSWDAGPDVPWYDLRRKIRWGRIGRKLR